MYLSVRNYLRGPYTLYRGKEEQTINEPVPIAYKWLPGDLVDPESGSILEQKSSPLVGIVDYLSRTGQGFTPRGVPLYMFYPLSESYPPMIVAAKTNPKVNTIVEVNVEHWDSKWPRAGIKRILGTVGDKAVEKQALLMRSSYPRSKSENIPLSQTENHNPLPWSYVINIDPEGCVDVDDVLCWRDIDGGHEFCIAIADVSAHIEERSELDIAAAKLGQTLYVDGKAEVPMFPTSISESAASLRSDGLSRPALGLIYTLKGRYVTKRWERILVPTNRSYTYETVYEDKEICEKITNLLTSILGLDIGEDSHKWIEYAMLEYNKEAAYVLRAGSKGLLRSHAGTTKESWADLAAKTGCSDIAWFGYAAGKYVEATAEDVKHAGLSMDCYCHASSPLRRYADLVNQRWLKHLLFGDSAPQYAVQPTYLNERGRIAKQLDRDLWFLTHLQPDTITTVRGFVLKEKPDGRFTVYVPEWQRKITGKMSTDAMPDIGSRVEVRAYTNLKSPHYDQRLICSLVIADETCVTNTLMDH